MADAAEDPLVDRIYAAALDPSRWTSVIEAVADEIGAVQACLTRLSHLDGGGEGIEARIDPAAVQAFHEYYHTRNVFTLVDDFDAWRRGWRPTIVATSDCLPIEEYQRSEYFNDFMRPQDAGATLHLRLELNGTTSSAIAFGRAIRKGEFETEAFDRARQLQPHLIRAYRLGRTLAIEPGISQDLARALEATPQAVFVVDHDGGLRHANTLAEQLLRTGKGLTVLNGRLVAQQSDAARRLADAINAATLRDEIRQAAVLSLASPGGRFPLALRVTPLATDATPIFDRPRMALVTVTDLDLGVIAPQDELRLLFGLTPAEGRLSGAIFDGLGLPEAAERFGVSINTVRFQLARVFEKTGVTRQAELVKLMMRLTGGPNAR